NVLAAAPDHITVTGPASVNASAVSTAFTVSVFDALNNPAPVSGNTVFNLTSNTAGTATFYQADGTTVTTTATVTTGTSAITFKYKDTKANGATTVTATRTSGDALGAANANIAVNAAGPDHAVVTGPVSVTAGVVSSALTLTLQDAFNNPTNVSGNTVFNLTSNTSGTATFYLADGTTTTTTATVAAGTSSITFKYKDTKANTGTTVTATRTSGDALNATNANYTVNVTAPAP